MKRQIRKGAFETNSSSTHSIAISKEENLELKFPEELVFEYDEFGWEERKINTPEGKASYLYTALFYVYQKDRDKWKEYLDFILDTLEGHGVKCEFAGKITVEAYVSRWSNSKCYVYVDYECGGYIDHSDNLGGFAENLCSDENLLLSYLFSERSFILTGNDNAGTDVSIDVDYPVFEWYKGN